MKAGIFALLLVGVISVSQAAIVRVVGLFPDKALVILNGKRHLLEVGGKAIDGVRLVSSDSRKAVISHYGVQKEYFLTRDMGGGIQEPELKSVRINRNNQGQYISQGVINNRSVSMLVDTGANVVAINQFEAQRLGIDYKEGQTVRVETASGVVKGYRVKLDFISVGGIRQLNVEATVLEGGSPEQVLLGMSYLKHVRFSEEGGVMLLESRF